MRRVLRAAEAQDAEGERFRARLKQHHKYGIDGVDWRTASAVYRNDTFEEITEAERSVRLARRMQDRMADTMKDDPRRTVIALALYGGGAHFVEHLLEAWQEVKQGQAVKDAQRAQRAYRDAQLEKLGLNDDNTLEADDDDEATAVILVETGGQVLEGDDSSEAL
jgi:hypothetical protein